MDIDSLIFHIILVMARKGSKVQDRKEYSLIWDTAEEWQNNWCTAKINIILHPSKELCFYLMFRSLLSSAVFESEFANLHKMWGSAPEATNESSNIPLAAPWRGTSSMSCTCISRALASCKWDPRDHLAPSPPPVSVFALILSWIIYSDPLRITGINDTAFFVCVHRRTRSWM